MYLFVQKNMAFSTKKSIFVYIYCKTAFFT